MEGNIKFDPSAFKHGISETDIRQAMDTFIYEDPLNDHENKYLILGFDTRGILLEVMYNMIDEERINVFHAMPCRKAFYNLIRSKQWPK